MRHAFAVGSRSWLVETARDPACGTWHARVAEDGPGPPEWFALPLAYDTEREALEAAAFALLLLAPGEPADRLARRRLAS